MSPRQSPMHPVRDPQPPRWAQRFIEWYCKPQLAEDLLGDLLEYFERNVKSKGVFCAKLIYCIDAFKFFRPYTVRAPEFVTLLINWIMIGNHLKTSVRNGSRNKLFTTINIVGLAIGMSVGLLLIAFLHDLRSYDTFHENGGRIYRINSHAKFREGYSSTFASTSVKVGKLIPEKVTGVKETAILRSDFAGDVEISDRVIPITGFYAEPSLLRIFTFPMVKGDAATALVKPHSVVLTEASAKKLFGTAEAFGKSLHINNLDYQVTGILKDVPFFSHIQFESLVSFSTLETQMANDPDFHSWASVYQRNYVYLLRAENSKASDIQAQLNAICDVENEAENQAAIHLSLLPLFDIMLGEDLENSVRPVMPRAVLWIISGLALIVILSACFNYTNLSIARSMRRFREVGLRKVIGAGKSQVRQQFIIEAIIVSLGALLISFGMFLVLRPQLISMAPELINMVKLEITLPMVLAFIAFAILVGVVAGLLPAVFFANVSALQAMRDASSVKVFSGLSFRRALVVVQYTLTLTFITSTFIGYVQYKDILAFDLGFTTENILNIELQGNKPEALISKLTSLPEVTGVSQSKIVTSVGNAWGGFVKYKDLNDSTLVFSNIIDEHYLPVHEYQLIAGQNFITRPATKAATSEIIVNEKTLRLFNIANGDPQQAIGEELWLSSRLDRKKLTIVGVIKDFHYGKLNEDIKPVAFTYLTPDTYLRPDKMDGLLNVRLATSDPMETMAKIQGIWKSVDPVHPFAGRFYKEDIEEAYNELSVMIKVIGFLSFLAISIASLGLLGMVVYTTQTKLREMSIRKVLGATTGNLVFILSRGFAALLVIAAGIALPITYIFFEKVVLINFPFHEPIGAGELFGGLMAVVVIAFIMIGSQTVKAARSNPAEILKSE